MARLNVNPTRMELKKLKARLATAVRGHKLLKDKVDEMIRRFSALIRSVKTEREALTDELIACLGSFSLASAQLSLEALALAFSMPSGHIEASFGIDNLLSIEVPTVQIKGVRQTGLPYAYSEVTSEADHAATAMTAVVQKLLALSAKEKTVSLLSYEIERNKRRVNALEHIVIPQLQETIRYIKSKLDENERAATIRLLKFKNTSL